MPDKLFSVVAALYNVSGYLDDFLGSLDRQTCGTGPLEVVLVDDGSTDDTLERIESWAAGREHVRVITQANAGQGAARNAGLKVATGAWVSFVDPDDYLADDYLASMQTFMTSAAGRGAAMYNGNHLVYLERSNEVRDQHPLRFRFKKTRVVNLDENPRFVCGLVNSAFFDRRLLVEAGIEFDQRVRPKFEDGHFVARYLVHAKKPTVGLVAGARYYYRKRRDESSAVDQARFDKQLYSAVPRLGHLGALEHAIEHLGHAPAWLQNLVLYDLSWLLREAARVGTSHDFGPEDVSEFRGAVAATMAHIDEVVVSAFNVVAIPQWVRALLFLECSPGEDMTPIQATAQRDRRPLSQLSYFFTGELPEEQIKAGGVRLEPAHSTVRTQHVLGEVWLRQRIIWLKVTKAITVQRDGRAARIFTDKPWWRSHQLLVRELRQQVQGYEEGAIQPFLKSDESMLHRAARALLVPVRAVRNALSRSHNPELATRVLLKSYPVRSRYRDAWVFTDRKMEANDSAEELYRWVRANRPEVNAWFVVSKESSDWERLKADGFRLVSYDTRAHRLLMLKAAHLVSSHADTYVVRPYEVERFGKPQWRYTFLNHGVIKGDLSNWLNAKEIDLFVTSTVGEYESIAGENNYKFSSKEVRLTGLPRWDSLQRKADSLPAGHERLLLVAPTWREYLSARPDDSSEQATELTAKFAASEYARSWLGFLSSDKLRLIAEAHGLQIVFLPHPHIRPFLPAMHLPEHVRLIDFATADVQEVMASSAMMVTDYSSVAFNLGFLGRPTVYFQFDSDTYFTMHTEQQSYFTYEADGFGPVVRDVDGAVAAVDDLLAGGDAAATYLQRIEETYTYRDAENSRRVYEAIASVDDY